jgi:MFS family permease
MHSGLAAIQSVTSGYLLALPLVLPLNGWLVDRIGAKALYLWCFTGFTLSSALCALAWSANSLIAFRILQGISGGLLAPMAQMMVARAVGKHMARVVGYMALPILLAPVLGPVVAGVILQYASWRWLFLVNLPVGALAFLWMVRRKGDEALIDLRLFESKIFSTAAYTSVCKRDLPMATTSLNIVQRLGGPTLTTLCASFLAWTLGSQVTGHAVSTAYAWAFLLLCGLHAFTFLAASRLPLRVNGPGPC